MFETLTLCAGSAYLLFVGLYLKTSNIKSLLIFKFTPIVLGFVLGSFAMVSAGINFG
jgi:hypothetical protein